MKYPTRAEINEVLSSIEDDEYEFILPKNSSKIDKVKYEFCQIFRAYIRNQKITQAELARRLNIDRSRVNWIVKYKFEHFTIDRLYQLLDKLNLNIDLELKAS